MLKSKNSIVGQKNNVTAKMKRKKRKIDTLDALGEEIITILTTINICLRSYLIIVTDATDAVSVNFFGRCKFLQI